MNLPEMLRDIEFFVEYRHAGYYTELGPELAALVEAADGSRTATPFAKQDSSMQRTFREAQALIVRPPFAKVAAQGDVIRVLRLDF